MKKTRSLIALLFLMIFSSIGLNAQNGPVAAGGNAIGENGRVSYSVGQVNFITATAGGGTITQGIQQPYEIFDVGIEDNQNIRLLISAYPNPTANQVLLKVENMYPLGLFYQVFDQNSRLLMQNELEGNITLVPLQELTSGTYFLKVYEKGTDIKSFKIIKN